MDVSGRVRAGMGLSRRARAGFPAGASPRGAGKEG